MVNTKHAFWLALVFTILIFGVGLIFGFFLENSRNSVVETNLMHSEIDLLDEQVRSGLISTFGLNCEINLNSTFSFADRIYSEALKLEVYDSASQLSDTLNILHGRYDLLRMILWGQAMELKKNCKSNFHIVVYFFDYNTQDINKKSLQNTFSKMLTDMKLNHGKDVLLIPLASDLNITSINDAELYYNITKIPSILIDQNKVIDELPTNIQLEDAIFQNNKR